MQSVRAAQFQTGWYGNAFKTPFVLSGKQAAAYLWSDIRNIRYNMDANPTPPG
jgi:hypothetical protein